MTERTKAADDLVNYLKSCPPSISQMPIRDWFAGMALQAAMATKMFGGNEHQAIAQWAYRQADAMLAYAYGEKEARMKGCCEDETQ